MLRGGEQKFITMEFSLQLTSRHLVFLVLFDKTREKHAADQWLSAYTCIIDLGFLELKQSNSSSNILFVKNFSDCLWYWYWYLNTRDHSSQNGSQNVGYIGK